MANLDTFFGVEAVDQAWDEVGGCLVLAGLVVGFEGVVDDLGWRC